MVPGSLSNPTQLDSWSNERYDLTPPIFPSCVDEMRDCRTSGPESCPELPCTPLAQFDRHTRTAAQLFSCAKKARKRSKKARKGRSWAKAVDSLLQSSLKPRRIQAARVKLLPRCLVFCTHQHCVSRFQEISVSWEALNGPRMFTTITQSSRGALPSRGEKAHD